MNVTALIVSIVGIFGYLAFASVFVVALYFFFH